jgi:plasmid stabilization system protein ParE
VTLRLVVDPAAEVDILEAFRWYEISSLGLGNRFLDSLDSAFQSIIDNPVAFPNVIEDVRRTLTKTFPYLVFFTANEESVYILAVIHASQDPDYITSRLDA